ncbi:unnamed protein product [Paramecium sonneborni]|uniref:Folate/biopterin transporter n=1 Tax=Paramecium sonneborni TaxID=65129 RepID=A0A8S1M610_9CILI|nr:unnamed protein product [Paramecium sonneborni]
MSPKNNIPVLNLTQIIVGIVAFSQGVQHLADLSIQYLYKDDFHVSPSKMGVFVGLSQLPWIIKPIWGIICDSFPILGSRRKAYIVFCGFLSFIGWQLMAYIGVDNVYVAVALLIMISSSVCICNVVGEALMVEQCANDHAANNVSVFFGFKATGGLISAYFSGMLLMYLTKKQIFLINSLFPLTMALLSLKLKETQQTRPSQNIKEVLSVFWTFFSNPKIYQPVLLILAFMMVPSSSSIMFYFYTEVLHFTPRFMGYLKFISCLGTLLAILLYRNFLKDVNFKKIFVTTTIAFFFCYLSTIPLVTRMNVQWGIDDRFFCLGDSVILQFIGELNLLPILVYACKICPKNIEATMYAMLMATMNFGTFAGGQLGNLILYEMGINQQDYSNLYIFIALSSIFFILPLPWIHLINDKAIQNHQEQEPPQIQDNEEKQNLIASVE